jgi:hypothetical protein
LSEATGLAESIAAKAKESNEVAIVAQIEFGSDAKVVRKIHEKLKSIHPTASYFVASFDDELEK